MNQIPLQTFVHCLKNGTNMKEVCFLFCDDTDQQERWLGQNPDQTGYWVGNCDRKEGAEFGTVDELMNAPVFDGKSLQQRYAQMRIVSVEGCSLQDWLAYFELP